MNESIAKFVGGLIGVGVGGDLGGRWWLGGGGGFLMVRRLWFQKVPAIYEDFVFFPKKPPILKIQVRFFST